jgi:hypothetical protein
LRRHAFKPNGEGQSILQSSANVGMAFEVNSVSLTTAWGFPHAPNSVASSRATLAPDRDVSAIRARHSRVQTMPFKMDKKRAGKDKLSRAFQVERFLTLTAFREPA